MSQRSVDVKIGADTSGFLTGISDVVAKLNVLNKQMLESQAATKKINQGMREYEKEQAKIQKEIKESGSATDEQKEKLAKLEQKLDDARSKAAELKTEQSKLKSEIKSASKELDEQTEGLNKVANAEDDVKQATDEMKVSVEKSSEGFTVMKGAISNLVSDALNVAVDKFKEMAVSSEQTLNSLQVKTGMSTEAVSELKDEMYAIYKDNFGDSLTDVADKIALVAQNIDESDPSKIKSITENAIGLSDAFGSDFEENLRGVNGLMTNMGLTADEAFDLIAKGSQNGLDKTHELTDNLAEYSQIWSQAGFSAEEMFSILQNGLDSGAYNLDKVNDFVKEFAISLADGRIAENISSFSNESKNLFEEWKSGKATQADVFQSIISDLSNMTNQQEALTLASTVWSSLGEDNAMSVLTSLNKVNDKYTDVAGTMQEINDIQYNDAGSQIEALGRQFEVDILQPVVNEITPTVKNTISWVSEHLPEVTSALAGLITSVVTFKTATAAGNFLSSIVNGFKQLSPAIKAATTEQATNNAVTAANPYVVVASAVLGLISALITLRNTNNDVAESIKKVNEFTEGLEENATQQRQTLKTEIEQINSLNSVYDKLRNKTSLTSDEKNTLSKVSEELANKLGIEQSDIQNLDGSYKSLNDSIDDYIKKAQQRVEMSIVESNWQATANELAVAERELTKLNDDYNKIFRQDYTGSASDAAATETALKNKKTEISLLEKEIEGYKNQYNSYINDMAGVNKKFRDSFNPLSDFDEFKKAITDVGNSANTTKEKTEELTNALSKLASSANTIATAEKEYNENGKLTISTLQTIIDKYPSLTSEVYNYIAGVTDAKTLIASMKNTYNDDANAFLVAQVNKNANNADFYKNVMLANTEWVNDCKNKYNIDLTNYATWAQARSNITSKIIKQVSALPGIGPLLGNVLTSAQDTWFDYVLSQYTSKFVTAKDSILNLNNINNSNDEKDKKDKIKKITDESKKAEDTLLKKYELVEAAYNRLVDKRIERIQKEQEAKEKAKNAAIAAIDAEVEARKRLNEDKESQNELDTINARLKYEKLDELSRRELMRRKQELLNEQAEIKWQRMMSDKKDKLQSSYDSYKNNSDSMIEALQRAANSAADYFDTLKNGYKTNSYIVNNNSDTRNIQIIQNALSNQQMVDKLLKAIYSK